MYQVSASSVEGSQFCSFLEVPQVRLRKVSDTFVFWKDAAQGKVLGLSFASERDTLRLHSPHFPHSCTIESSAVMTLGSSAVMTLGSSAVMTLWSSAVYSVEQYCNDSREQCCNDSREQCCV